MRQKKCWVLEIGSIKYEDAFELQKRLVDARLQHKIEDTLLLLEHAPVFTANRKETFQNILVSHTVLEQEGIAVCQTDRGGDVTYHGPGQIVGYSIMDLKEQGKDLHAYIRNMEQVLIETLAEFGITAGRDRKHPGVWVGNEKLAAIGIAVKSGWITMHGFALNLDPNMEHFKLIIPCGIVGKGVTSMKQLLGKTLKHRDVSEKLIEHYAAIFKRVPQRITMEELPWS